MPTWLADDPRPLDWNGPVDRPFTRFPDSALDRPIIEHFEQAARRYRSRIAIRDADTALTYGELWEGLSGLADTLAADSKSGELIGILLPASPMSALAMLACLAAGRPFVALDPDHPQDWLEHAMRERAADPAHHGRNGPWTHRASRVANARHPADGRAPACATGLATCPARPG